MSETESKLKEATTIEVLRALGSGLLQRMGLANRGTGSTFGDKRRMYEVLGYRQNLGIGDYRDRYERGDISATIVDAWPDATWLGQVEVYDDPDPDKTTPFEQACKDLAIKTKLFPVLNQADRLSGLGQYGVILIGAPGDLDARLPRNLKGPDGVAFLQAFAEDQVTINREDLEKDPTNPRFGQPKFYQLKIDDEGNFSGGIRKIHWSRVQHLADNVSSGILYGQPRLKKVWNRLDDLDKVVGGGSEAFWMRAHQGYQFDINPDMNVTQQEKDELSAKIDEFVHGMRRALRTRGVTMNTTGSDVADFRQPVDAILTLISSATRIPKRILLGSESGELASSQDAKQWNERVMARRTGYAELYILRPMIDRFIKHGVLPPPANGRYFIWWPRLDELTELEMSQVIERVSRANVNMGERVITSDEFRDRFFDYKPLSDADKKLPEEAGALSGTQQKGATRPATDRQGNNS